MKEEVELTVRIHLVICLPCHHRRRAKMSGLGLPAKQRMRATNHIFDEWRSHMDIMTNCLYFLWSQMRLTFTQLMEKLLCKVLLCQPNKGSRRRLVDRFPKQSKQSRGHISLNVFCRHRIVSSTFSKAIATTINLCVELAETALDWERIPLETILQGLF